MGRNPRAQGGVIGEDDAVRRTDYSDKGLWHATLAVSVLLRAYLQLEDWARERGMPRR